MLYFGQKILFWIVGRLLVIRQPATYYPVLTRTKTILPGLDRGLELSLTISSTSSGSGECGWGLELSIYLIVFSFKMLIG